MCKQRCFCFVLLLAACCGYAAKRVAVAGAQRPGIVWKAQLFEKIPPAKSEAPGRKVKLGLLPGAIWYESNDRDHLEIPLSSVSEITHEMTARNLGGMIFDAIKEGYRSNRCDNSCVYGLMIAPLFMPFNKRAHYVTLAWQDDSDVRRAVFRMSKSDYRSFMESVSTASGQPSRDLAEEQKKTRRELKQQLRSAPAVRLEHEVALGGIVLKPRVYKVLLAESLNGGSEVSFFAGDKRALTLPVDIAAGGAAARAPVTYQQLETGDWTVAEIRIPGKVLSFPSAEPTAADSSGDITEDREY